MNPSQDDIGHQEVSGYFVPVAASRTASASSLIDVRGLLIRFRFLLVGGAVIGVLAALAVSFIVTPKFRAEVLLSPVEYSPNSGALSQIGGTLGGLGALAGLNLGDGSSRNESIAVLGSKVLTTEFMKDQDLLPVIFAKDWDAASDAWRPTDENEIPTLEDGYRVFDEDIRDVLPDRETGLVRLTMTWSDRRQAAQWANLLVERANTVIRERAVEEYQNSIDYLNTELQKTTVVGVRQAIYSVIESQIEQVMLATVREDYAFKVLDPAVAPDADDTEFPNRPLFGLVGMILGFAVSAVLALTLDRRRHSAAGA